MLMLMLSFSYSVGQTDRKFVLETLNFLNREFHIHFEQMGEPILVSYNEDEFLCYDFTKPDNKKVYSEVRFQYRLKRLSDKRYSFKLKVISTTNGIFELNEVNGKSYFKMIRFVDIIE